MGLETEELNSRCVSAMNEMSWPLDLNFPTFIFVIGLIGVSRTSLPLMESLNNQMEDKAFIALVMKY